MNTATTREPVLVGFDGSDQSVAALDWALDEAESRNLPVHILVARAMPLPSHPGLPPNPWPEALAQELLHVARVHAHQRSPVVHVTTSTVVGAPAGRLVNASRAAHTVVVGNGYHSALGEAIVGSTSSQVAAHAECTVVVVDNAAAPRRSPGTIALGVDGSQANESAIAYAFDAAALRDAELVAVHAWWLDVPERVGLSWMSEESLRRIGQEQEALLAEALSGWSQKYPDVVVRRDLSRQRPVDALLAAAKAADLLVVGSRGRGGFAGLILGSVSQGLLHRAHPCPVAVVHGAGDRSMVA
jgi:nucleotide-binding universal stress UspA family protein